MATLLHITTQADWERAERAGAYRIDSLDTEGFIHCSLPEQVAAVAERYYAGRNDLILLWIDDDLVEPEIRYEGDPEQYPHIYGPLNPNAVLRVTSYLPDQGGTFSTPALESVDDEDQPPIQTHGSG